MDTIFALATAQGRAGVAVIRVSGPQAFRVCGGLMSSLPDIRQAGLRKITDANGAILDEALVLTFAGPHSFTGEDVVELHVHGSPAIVAAVLRRLGETDARMAEPGEFSRRALENDRMDLTQVEALGDLISAETEAQRIQAMRGYEGQLSHRIAQWRADLIRAAALIEATIDFADEDVPVDVTPEVTALIAGVETDAAQELSGFAAAECVRNGFEVAIIGAPNAGKSTLLNAMARRDAAITSERAGTTRDVIEVRMDLDGLPVTVLDTAGLREAVDDIEAEGISRAILRAQNSDIRVFLLEENEDLGLAPEAGDIVLRPKSDLRADQLGAISGKTGAGVAELMSELAHRLSRRAASAGLATQERHRTAMSQTLESLQVAKNHLENGPDFYDIAAEDLRVATRALAALIGQVDVENLLDEIFASFCLGK
ncbi:MAG: tRNA uridine-5-carboxymethylaminomethyl(34) synthesis GTPase MnmE [Pseudomonadota bacterium]